MFAAVRPRAVYVCVVLGRLAQWESASLTRKRSEVQSFYRPPFFTPVISASEFPSSPSRERVANFVAVLKFATNVLIQPGSYCRAAVPQRLSRNLGRYALLEQQRSEAMAQIVETQ
jgi:hypothetical protein